MDEKDSAHFNMGWECL